MNKQTRTPRPFLIYVAACSIALVGMLATLWTRYPPQLSVQMVLLIAAVLLSENFAFSIEPYQLSLSFPLGIASAVLCGPTAACIVAASSEISTRELRQGKPPSVLLFNLAQVVLSTGFAAAVYVWLGGRVLQVSAVFSKPLNAADFPKVLFPLVVMAILSVFGNMLLTAGGRALLTRTSLQDTTKAMVAFVPTQFALVFVGVLIAQVLAISYWALPLFVAPLVVARQLYLRYAGLKTAYVDTIRSLIGALEAKDPYTRGHSERVSGYAAELGVACGLEQRALERLEYAGLLHDLGKLAVPGAVLSKPGRLSAEEMDRIREHPSRGAEMVKRIPHLRDLADTVAQHHERIDGTGYPRGVDGSEMPIAARILAVADSFDAMTTTRAYRPALNQEQAVAELLGGAGTQFDPEVVRVFIEVGIGQSKFANSEGPPEVVTSAHVIGDAQ
ncbi:MAG: HD-GYP domain-containing protein [Coriobacteriia bacterium]|nr:HD-GYP domain-containing protein [Coriobacteriia bacterium]